MSVSQIVQTLFRTATLTKTLRRLLGSLWTLAHALGITLSPRLMVMQNASFMLIFQTGRESMIQHRPDSAANYRYSSGIDNTLQWVIRHRGSQDLSYANFYGDGNVISTINGLSKNNYGTYEATFTASGETTVVSFGTLEAWYESSDIYFDHISITPALIVDLARDRDIYFYTQFKYQASRNMFQVMLSNSKNVELLIRYDKISPKADRQQKYCLWLVVVSQNRDTKSLALQ